MAAANLGWHALRERLLDPAQTQSLLAASATHIHDEDFPDLLRGIPLRSILHRLGALLDNTDILHLQANGLSGLFAASSVDADQLYARSHAVHRLEVFVSHSWATPRAAKFLALAVHFRLGSALAGVTLVSALGCAAQLAGWTPPGFLAPRVQVPASCMWHVLMSSITFWVGGAVLLLVLGFGLPCGGPGPTCFFDRACIHQTDIRRKTAAIKSLGGFVARSDELLALWTGRYFTRLWCVFELACHSAANGGSARGINVFPLSYALIFVSLQYAARMSLAPALITAWLVPASEERPTVVSLACNVFFNVTNVAFIVMYVHIFRARVKDVLLMREQLQGFSCIDAQCFEPSDRQLVLGCIRAWFGSTAAFDDFVRRDLAPQVIRLHGRLQPVLCMRYTLLACVPFFCEFFDVLPSHVHEPRKLLDYFLIMVPGMLLQIGAVVYLMSHVAKLQLLLEGLGLPVVFSYVLGTALGNCAIWAGLFIFGFPLRCMESLPVHMRAAYVCIALVALWAVELCGDSSAACEHALQKFTGSSVALLHRWATISAMCAVMLLALCWACITIVGILPACPAPWLHMWADTLALPCGIMSQPI